MVRASTNSFPNPFGWFYLTNKDFTIFELEKQITKHPQKSPSACL